MKRAMKSFLVIGVPTKKDLKKARKNLMIVVFAEPPSGKPNQEDRLMSSMVAYKNWVEGHPLTRDWIKSQQNIHYYGVTSEYLEVISIFKNSVKTLNLNRQ